VSERCAAAPAPFLRKALTNSNRPPTPFSQWRAHVARVPAYLHEYSSDCTPAVEENENPLFPAGS
jgi:hypothetical protein